MFIKDCRRICTLRKVDQKYRGSFETRCWRRVEKMDWINRVRNEEELEGVKEERNILQKVKRKEGWLTWPHLA